MSQIENKCVMVVDEELPIGLIANTALIMGVNLGREIDGLVGDDVNDSLNRKHVGIIKTPVPVLKADKAKIKEIRDKLYQNYPEVYVADFSDIAQSSLDYSTYINSLNTIDVNDLNYLGIAIYGNKKTVNKLTGSMPLLK